MHDALSSLEQRWVASSPWWTPYRPLAQAILFAARASTIIAALNAACEKYISPVRFCEHAALPPGEAYEAFIYRTKCVPTRENLHDFFNALVWLRYPHTKLRLNQLQAEQIALHGTSGPRGALRDALTLFDENAVILQAPASVVEALRRRDWHSVFIGQRAQWDSVRILIFGHALLEKLLEPRKGITAHAWLIASKIEDTELSMSLNPERLASKPFLPLPVLGIPGWWKANESPQFYEDAEVFRPLRDRAS